MSEFRVGIGMREGDVYTRRQASVSAHTKAELVVIFTYTRRQA